MSSMGCCAVTASFLIALLPSGAAAQPVAPTLRELQTLLKPGDYVVVIDKSSNETWGQAVHVSGSGITVAPAVRRGESVTISGERRVFDDANIGAVLRSNDEGVKGETIYPASWHAVDALAAGTDVTVTLTGGERRRLRLASVTASALQGLTPPGQQETLNRSEIVRIQRHGFADPTADGAVIGALIGAGVGFGITKAAYAACDGSCDAPAPGPMYLGIMTFNAGIGTVVGWIVDRMHKGKETVFPVVSPIVTKDRKGIALVLRF